MKTVFHFDVLFNLAQVGPSPPSPLCIIPEVASLVHSHVDHQTQRPGKGIPPCMLE